MVGAGRRRRNEGVSRPRCSPEAVVRHDDVPGSSSPRGSGLWRRRGCGDARHPEGSAHPDRSVGRHGDSRATDPPVEGRPGGPVESGEPAVGGNPDRAVRSRGDTRLGNCVRHCVRDRWVPAGPREAAVLPEDGPAAGRTGRSREVPVRRVGGTVAATSAPTTHTSPLGATVRSRTENGELPPRGGSAPTGRRARASGRIGGSTRQGEPRSEPGCCRQPRSPRRARPPGDWAPVDQVGRWRGGRLLQVRPSKPRERTTTTDGSEDVARCHPTASFRSTARKSADPVPTRIHSVPRSGTDRGRPGSGPASPGSPTGSHRRCAADPRRAPHGHRDRQASPRPVREVPHVGAVCRPRLARDTGTR